jgi:hypothetical protein
MKITKTKLRQIIMEEVDKDKALIAAIETLNDNIESLDISIDFLSAAFIGGDPLSIGAAQKSIGRAYRPVMNRPPQMDEGADSHILSKEVCSEIQQMIDEHLGALDGSGITKREVMEAQNQIDVLEEMATMRGCKQ